MSLSTASAAGRGKIAHDLVPVMNRVMRVLASRYDHDRFSRVQGPDPFRILVGCLISLRTRDEVTYPATERLFQRADSPARMLRLSKGTIEKLIYPAAFFRRKTEQIRAICRQLIDEHRQRVPDEMQALLELPGVGRKTANMVLTLGFGKPGICVDVHVHRIANRLGWVETDHPDRTELALRRLLPRKHWTPINEVFVRHGQQVCKPLSPICSICPVKNDCPGLGLERSR